MKTLTDTVKDDFVDLAELMNLQISFQNMR